MHFTLASVARFWFFWFVGCLLMSWFSGWWLLARRYGEAAPPQRWRHIFASGSLARAHWPAIQYHATFFLAWNEQGLTLAVFFPVRLAHARLHLPWPTVSAVRRVPWLGLWQQTEIQFEQGRYRLRLRGRAGTQAFNAAQQQRASCGP